MPEPVTIGALTVGGLGYLAGKAGEALAGQAGTKLLGALRDRFGGLVPGQDTTVVTKALRVAQLQALEQVIRQYEHAVWPPGTLGEPPPFLAASRAFCARMVGRSGDLSLKQNSEVTDALAVALDSLLAPAAEGPAAARAAALGGWVEELVLAELRAGLPEVPLPPGFEAYFRQRAPGDAAAHRRFLDHFTERVLAAAAGTAEFRAILNTLQLARLDGTLFGLGEALFAQEQALDRIARGVGRTEAKIDALPAEVVAQLMNEFERRGLVPPGSQGGTEREILLRLANRLRPEDVLELDQAVAALEQMVEIARAAIDRGAHPGNQDALVELVLAEVGRRTAAGEYDEGAAAIDAGLARVDTHEAVEREANQRARKALLEAGVSQDILRRDAARVGKRIEALVATGEGSGPVPCWPAFCAQFDAYYTEGLGKGVNFSLDVAIILARRMAETAGDADERGAAQNNLGNALSVLGERESGTARLEAAVVAYRAALEEWRRDRVPLD